jgi:hypothetical protein
VRLIAQKASPLQRCGAYELMFEASAARKWGCRVRWPPPDDVRGDQTLTLVQTRFSGGSLASGGPDDEVTENPNFSGTSEFGVNGRAPGLRNDKVIL